MARRVLVAAMLAALTLTLSELTYLSPPDLPAPVGTPGPAGNATDLVPVAALPARAEQPAAELPQSLLRASAPTTTGTVPTTEEPPPGSSYAITVSGDRILRNGRPWWLTGYNSFSWSGDCGDPEERMSAGQVDEWFSSMRHDGHGAARLFFYEGWDLERLDAAVASARRNDIYLIITLDDAIGGCGENDKTSDWFDDAGEVAAYREHMTTLLERYEGESAIAWFEYFNEPKDVGGKVREFIDEMGALADRIDPARLWSTGTIAPYGTGGEAGYLDINRSPHVDVASMHEYDEGEVESNHGDDSRANSAGKPVIVGEFGIKASDGGGCGTSFADRAQRFRRKIEAYTTIKGYAGALAWSWQPGNAGECRFENIDADLSAQEILRTVGG